MRVHLLGTGSADRWPNPWCSCGSCAWARATGILRDRTSVLIDDTLLIDPGPDAGGRGADLSQVRTVLVTHDHPDHLDPTFLLAWTWASQRGQRSRDMVGSTDRRIPVPLRPPPADTARTDVPPPALVVAGPQQAMDRCRQWVAPEATIELRPVRAGETFVAGDHRVRVLPAAHSTTGGHAFDGTALLFDIASAEARILYATDTAALPHGELCECYDLVLLEETFGDLTDHGTAHLDHAGFAAQVAELRRHGRIAAGGRVVAVHLSHYNGSDLVARLARIGADVLPDGTTLTVGDTARRAEAEPTTAAQSAHPEPPAGAVGDPSGSASSAPGAAHRRPATASGLARSSRSVPLSQPRRLLVTGGARSGKSRYAESMVSHRGVPVTYVATAPSYPDDPEWRARVAAHRARRPESWRTVESADVAKVLQGAEAGECVLVDCLTLWLTAAFDVAGWHRLEQLPRAAEDALDGLLFALSSCRAEVALVTNEVGSGVVPDQASGRLFRDLLGRTNASVAAACSEVVLITAGIPIALKGTPWTSST